MPKTQTLILTQYPLLSTTSVYESSSSQNVLVYLMCIQWLYLRRGKGYENKSFGINQHGEAEHKSDGGQAVMREGC